MSHTLAIIILALLWTAWCFVHSLLISRTVTAKMQEFLGSGYGWYRLAYNIFSLLSLIPVVFFQLHLAEKVIFAWPRPWYLLKLALYGAAFLLFYGGSRIYDLRHMLGMRQIEAMKHGGEPAPVEFSTAGILGYVRHPWYSGAILLVWAFGPLTDVSLVSKVILTAYIIIGTLLEEKKLLAEIGEPYRRYRQRVPMFIPWRAKK